MPFASVEGHNSCLPALSALKQCHQDLEPEGIIENRHFPRVHQNSLYANSMPDLSKTQLPRFAQTPLPSFAELMRRIQDAAKNQTARNPEFTVLDSRNVRQGSRK